MLDVDLLMSFVREPLIELQDAGPAGIYAQFLLARRGAHAELRRYRLHPLTIVLLARLQRASTRAPLQSRRGEPRDTVARLRLRVDGDTGEAFADQEAALRWLVACQMPRTRLIERLLHQHPAARTSRDVDCYSGFDALRRAIVRGGYVGG